MSKHPASLILIAVLAASGVLQACAPANNQPPAAEPATPTAGLPSVSRMGMGQRTKTSGCVSADGLPDPGCTPGAILAGATVDQLCRPGYVSSAAEVPQQLQDEAYAAYGIASPAPGEYEIDHLVPAELGGSNDIANLWPESAQSSPGAEEKAKVEKYLFQEICAGRITLPQAQNAIATNWVELLSRIP